MLISIKKNILANYVGSFYTTIIGVVMLPIYLKFMGAEAFGLVGFFTLLMTWLSLITAGISPTIGRQIAYHRGMNTLWGSKFRELFRSIELIVLFLGLVSFMLVTYISGWLSNDWLKVTVLPIKDVAYCITIMGSIIGLRWLTSLYTSGLSGMEWQIWLNGFNAVFATIRFVIVYILLRWITNNPTHYFEFQLCVSFLELSVAAWKFYSSQPKASPHLDPGVSFSAAAIKELAPFAAGVTYTSLLWILMTQSDKLILSHVLTLAEYGYFAIVIVISNGVLMFSAPINQAVLPRMTKLFTEGNEAGMLALYRKSSQYLTVVAFSVSGSLAFFSKEVIFVLTGNQAASQWGGEILTWFALGNCILIIVGMQFLLQYVHGKLKLHIINTTINALVQVPILVYIALNFGAIEVAKAWFAIRLVTFFIWPPLVHRKFALGLHLEWLKTDILPPMIGCLATLFVIKSFASAYIESLDSRLSALGILCLIGICVLFISSFSASNVRDLLIIKIENFKNAFIK